MVESSLVAWSLPVVIQIPIFRSLWKRSVTTWNTRNDGVRRIKILLCFHTKYLAAGLCEFRQLNKIWESQGEDNQAFVVVFSYKKICLQGCVSFTTLHKNWEWRGEKWSCWVVFVQENLLCRMWISFTTWTKIQKQWDEENEAIGWFLYKIICLQDVNFFHNLNTENDELRRVKLLGFFNKNNCLQDVIFFHNLNKVNDEL